MRQGSNNYKSELVVKRDSLYLVGYALVLFNTFINSTTFQLLEGNNIGFMIRLTGYLLIISHIGFKRKVKMRYFAIGIIMLVISLLSLSRSGYSVLLDYAICCVFALNVDFSKIVKVYVVETILLTMITVIAAMTGRIENFIYYRRATGDIRMSMGFIYPTNCAAHIFFIMVGIAFLYYEKFNWKHVLGYCLTAFAVYSTTNARGPAAMIIILSLVVYFYRFFSLKDIYIIPDWLLKYSTVICALITFLLIFFYNADNAFWKAVNAFTTNRLTYAKNIMNNNKVTLFGQFIAQRGDGNGGRSAGEAYTYIDLSFQRILLMYGLLLFVFIIIYSVLLYNKCVSNQNYTIPLLMLVVAFYSLTAQHYFDFSYNFLLLCYFADISPQKIVERKKHWTLR